MNKVTDYRIIFNCESNNYKEIRSHLESGWQLWGSPFSEVYSEAPGETTSAICQAMVKMEEPEQ